MWREPKDKLYTEDELLPVSGLQHLAYCERQFSLIHVEQIWSENKLTAEGRVIHERVHDPNYKVRKPGTIVLRSMPIKSQIYGLVGYADLVEFMPDDNGIAIHRKKGKFKLNPVEYKRGKAKEGDFDRVQLCAQALCLEEMFECSILTAELYYATTRRRQLVEIDDSLRLRTKALSSRMHEIFRERLITPVDADEKKCKQCSLKEECLADGLRQGLVSEYWKHAEKLLRDLQGGN